MPIYALKKGQKHFKRNEGGGPKARLIAMKPGETVRLTEKQYKSFSDKFEYVGRDEVELASDAIEEEAVKEVAPILVARDDGGYDLVNATTGVAINDNALSLAEVGAIIEEYNANVPEATVEAMAKEQAEVDEASVEVDKPITYGLEEDEDEAKEDE